MNEGDKPKSHPAHINDSGHSSKTSVVEVQPRLSKVLELNLNILIKYRYNLILHYLVLVPNIYYKYLFVINYKSIVYIKYYIYIIFYVKNKENPYFFQY